MCMVDLENLNWEFEMKCKRGWSLYGMQRALVVLSMQCTWHVSSLGGAVRERKRRVVDEEEGRGEGGRDGWRIRDRYKAKGSKYIHDV